MDPKNKPEMDTKATAYKYVFSPKIGGDTEGVENFSYSTPPTFCRPLNVLIARVYGLSMCCMDTFLPDTPIRKTGDPGTARLSSRTRRSARREIRARPGFAQSHSEEAGAAFLLTARVSRDFFRAAFFQ